ncbi:helix-turn-helix domain-containing protein [Marmoricola sp. RAF53]|uniref:helix-turn-helix domain-containing protein n=1 Tax=Marmoricola sp. RAF53 TaxID=3233059 RepID=UPI003F945B3A
MGEPLLSSAPQTTRPVLPPQTRWTNRVALGARIRNARLNAGLGPSALADGLTSIAYLSRIESSERRPSQQLLNELAVRLDVDVNSLTRGESNAADGLQFELAHADLLLATGQYEDALQVSSDLAEVATCIGANRVAKAARIVGTAALSATGEHGAALRMVNPLAQGPLGLLAMVVQARIHLAQMNPKGAIEVGRQVAVRFSVSHNPISLPEGADLAVTMCSAHQQRGQGRAAAHVARKTLAYMPAAADPQDPFKPTIGVPPVVLSYRTFDHASRHAEQTVSRLQAVKLQADLDLLRTHASRRPEVDEASNANNDH